MSEIVCDCAGELEMSAAPCKGVDYGYPVAVVLKNIRGTLTVAGESPTLAEIQSGIEASGVDRLIVVRGITNGQLVEANRQEETGADTADGLTDVVSINYALTGNIKLLDEVNRKHFAELNCNSRAYGWVITNKGYIRGGKNGNLFSIFFPPMLQEGFGVKSRIPINLEYVHNLNATDPMTQDDGFVLLDNLQTT